MEGFEDYLAGRLSPQERARMEAGLAGDPALQAALEQWKQHTEALQTLRIRQQVAKAIQIRKQAARARTRLRITWAALLLCMILVLAWLYWSHINSPAKEPLRQAPARPLILQDSTNPSPAPRIEEIPQKPVAPKKAAPATPIFADILVLRSAYEALDSSTLYLLQSLLELTGEQENADKTQTAILQLLGKGRSAETKSLILDYEKKDPAEARWLLAIAQLAEGRIEAAEALFNSLSRTDQQRRPDALKALQQLQRMHE